MAEMLEPEEARAGATRDQGSITGEIGAEPNRVF